MDQMLVLQYRRRGKRLQLIVLPWSFNVSAAALIRFTSTRDKVAHDHGWSCLADFSSYGWVELNPPDFTALH